MDKGLPLGRARCFSAGFGERVRSKGRFGLAGMRPAHCRGRGTGGELVFLGVTGQLRVKHALWHPRNSFGSRPGDRNAGRAL